MNTQTDNSGFHLLHCVMQTLRSALRTLCARGVTRISPLNSAPVYAPPTQGVYQCSTARKMENSPLFAHNVWTPSLATVVSICCIASRRRYVTSRTASRVLCGRGVRKGFCRMVDTWSTNAIIFGRAIESKAVKESQVRYLSMTICLCAMFDWQ